MDNHWLCPLYSFTCDNINVQLSDSIIIEYVPMDFKEWMQEQFPKSLLTSKDDPTNFNWVLKFSPPQYKSTPPDNYANDTLGSAHWYMNLITWAFRLYKKGNITPGSVYCFKNSISKLELLCSFEAALCKNGSSKQPFYQFNKKDYTHVCNILSILLTCFHKGFPGPFSVVFNRFNSAYHETAEDTLIDQMIAFESLLLDDDKELGYKLALRTAFLINRNKEIVFNNMKKAYNLRSLIVHGKKQVSNDELIKFLPLTEGYLRQSITTFVTLMAKGNTITEIRNMLDTNILKSSRTKK